MNTPRWSNFSVTLTILVVGAAAFYTGRRTERRLVPFSRSEIAVAQSRSTPEAFARDDPHDPVADHAEHGGDAWQKRWSELSGGLATPGREADMARVIEKLAVTDPRRAVSLAATENNFRLRTVLLRAALSGWGKTDPAAAAVWVESQTLIDPGAAFGALFQGAAADPERAIDLVGSLSRRSPGRAAEYGAKLISAFAEAGQFERAAAFALTAPAQTREGWMLPAFSRWAEFQPQEAAANAMRLADPADQAVAMNAVVIGWAPSDPKGLIEFAKKNLAGAPQNAVVARAVDFWAGADPVAAADWIGQNDFGAATDPGIAEIAGSPLLKPTPAVAASWAENITNPQLRLQTLGAVLAQWAATDAKGAERYIAASTTLAPDERAGLRERVWKK